MPVSVVCPACDMEQSADTPGGTIQCRTCWAKVPVPASADTPPPKADLPTARRVGTPVTPPRAKRAEESKRERKARSRREEKPKEKSGGWAGAAALLVLVLVGGAGLIVFMWPSPEPTAATPTTQAKTSTEVEPDAAAWVPVATPEGAHLLVPGPLAPRVVTVKVGTEPAVSGVCQSAADERQTVAEVYVFDLKPTQRADREDFLARLLEVRSADITRVGVKPIVGGDTTEYAAHDADGFDHAAWVIGWDGRWFVFHLKWKPETDPKERRKELFASKAAVDWVGEPEPAPPKPVKPNPVKPSDPKPPTPTPVTQPKPKDPKTEAEPITETWVAVENKAGFAAVAPKGVKPEKLIVHLNRVPLGGQKWQIEDAHCVYHLSYLDLPDGLEPDLPKLVKPLLGFGDGIAGSDDGKVDGRKATLWDLRKWDKQKAKGVTVACGFRVFTAFVTSKPGKGYGEDATFTLRTDKYLNSLKFTFDPKADDPYPGEPKWSTIQNTAGFAVRVPTATNSVKEHGVGFPSIAGKVYRAEAGGIVYEVYVHDVPAKRAAADVVNGVLGHDKLVSGPEEVKINDRKWTAGTSPTGCA